MSNDVRLMRGLVTSGLSAPCRPLSSPSC